MSVATGGGVPVEQQRRGRTVNGSPAPPDYSPRAPNATANFSRPRRSKRSSRAPPPIESPSQRRRRRGLPPRVLPEIAPEEKSLAEILSNFSAGSPLNSVGSRFLAGRRRALAKARCISSAHRYIMSIVDGAIRARAFPLRPWPRPQDTALAPLAFGFSRNHCIRPFNWN